MEIFFFTIVALAILPAWLKLFKGGETIKITTDDELHEIGSFENPSSIGRATFELASVSGIPSRPRIRYDPIKDMFKYSSNTIIMIDKNGKEYRDYYDYPPESYSERGIIEDRFEVIIETPLHLYNDYYKFVGRTSTLRGMSKNPNAEHYSIYKIKGREFYFKVPITN